MAGAMIVAQMREWEGNPNNLQPGTAGYVQVGPGNGTANELWYRNRNGLLTRIASSAMEIPEMGSTFSSTEAVEGGILFTKLRNAKTVNISAAGTYVISPTGVSSVVDISSGEDSVRIWIPNGNPQRAVLLSSVASRATAVSWLSVGTSNNEVALRTLRNINGTLTVNLAHNEGIENHISTAQWDRIGTLVPAPEIMHNVRNVHINEAAVSGITLNAQTFATAQAIFEFLNTNNNTTNTNVTTNTNAIANLASIVNVLQGVGLIGGNFGASPTTQSLTQAWQNVKGQAPSEGAKIINFDEEQPDGREYVFITNQQNQLVWQARGRAAIQGFFEANGQLGAIVDAGAPCDATFGLVRANSDNTGTVNGIEFLRPFFDLADVQKVQDVIDRALSANQGAINEVQVSDGNGGWLRLNGMNNHQSMGGVSSMPTVGLCWITSDRKPTNSTPLYTLSAQSTHFSGLQADSQVGARARFNFVERFVAGGVPSTTSENTMELLANILRFTNDGGTNHWTGEQNNRIAQISANRGIEILNTTTDEELIMDSGWLRQQRASAPTVLLFNLSNVGLWFNQTASNPSFDTDRFIGSDDTISIRAGSAGRTGNRRNNIIRFDKVDTSGNVVANGLSMDSVIEGTTETSILRAPDNANTVNASRNPSDDEIVPWSVISSRIPSRDIIFTDELVKSTGQGLPTTASGIRSRVEGSPGVFLANRVTIGLQTGINMPFAPNTGSSLTLGKTSNNSTLQGIVLDTEGIVNSIRINGTLELGATGQNSGIQFQNNAIRYSVEPTNTQIGANAANLATVGWVQSQGGVTRQSVTSNLGSSYSSNSTFILATLNNVSPDAMVSWEGNAGFHSAMAGVSGTAIPHFYIIRDGNTVTLRLRTVASNPNFVTGSNPQVTLRAI